MFPIIWPIAVILYVNNRKDTYIKWICLFLFIGGGGSYFAIMHSVIHPFLNSQGILSNIESNILTTSVLFFMSLFYFLLPYVFLMSSISLVHKESLIVNIVLLTPTVIFYLLEWPSLSQGVNIYRLHLWSGIYIIAGCLHYLYSIFKPKVHLVKRNNLRLSIIFIPIMILIFVKDFLSVNRITLTDKDIIFDQQFEWTISSFYIDFWLIFLFFFYSIRYGILGIKLRIEKQRLEASMTSMSLSTSIIHHTIKNEVQKIEYMLERAKDFVKQNNEMETIQSLNKIRDITSHLQGMSHIIKEKSEDIVLSEQKVDLTAQLINVLNSLMPLLDRRDITLVQEYEFEGKVICDPHHFQEVFSNLCMNAIEAISHNEGKLSIRTKRINNTVMIEVRDNGSGIDKKNWTKIFEPFFTTKKIPTNYGLGLTYCYQVMKKHQGNLKIIESDENRGTAFAIVLPKKRLVLVKKEVEGGITNDSDKDLASRG